MALKVNNQKLAVFHYYVVLGLTGYFYTRIGMLDHKISFNPKNTKALWR